MKRYDTCMINDEMDILECRMAELSNVIDVFVVVEADRTHGTNSPKPWNLEKEWNRFEEYHDRLRYIQLTGMPNDHDPWTREAAQREGIMQGLDDAGSEDIILLSDVDEIPRASTIREVSPAGHTVFMQRLHAMTLNWFDLTPWYGTVASRRCEIATMNRMRENRKWAPNVIENGGWHFSWLGGEKAMVEKFWNGCHSNDFDAEWDIKTGNLLGTQLRSIVIDDTYPEWVQDGNAPLVWFREGNYHA